MLGELRVDDFAPLVGASLGFESGQGGAGLSGQLALLSASPARRHSDAGRRAGFSLLLRGPLEPALDQGQVCLLHPRLGPLELFLVPVAAGADSRDYEVVFN